MANSDCPSSTASDQAESQIHESRRFSAGSLRDGQHCRAPSGAGREPVSRSGPTVVQVVQAKKPGCDRSSCAGVEGAVVCPLASLSLRSSLPATLSLRPLSRISLQGPQKSQFRAEAVLHAEGPVTAACALPDRIVSGDVLRAKRCLVSGYLGLISEYNPTNHSIVNQSRACDPAPVRSGAFANHRRRSLTSYPTSPPARVKGVGCRYRK